MNLIKATRVQLTQAFRHYACLRMQFRSTVLKDFSPLVEPLPGPATPKPVKH